MKMTRTSNGHAQKQLRHDFILGWSLIHDMPLRKNSESKVLIFSGIPRIRVFSRNLDSRAISESQTISSTFLAILAVETI